MLNKSDYEQRAKTLYAEIRDMERFIYDENYGGENLSNSARVRLNLLLSDMRKHHISLLETINLI